MRVLGVDYGDRKVGFAFGDTDLQIASPVEVWVHPGRDEEVLSHIRMLVDRDGIEAIVVGVPRQRDGALTKQGERHEEFARQLEGTLSLPVYRVDESFTSKESQRLLEEEGVEAGEDALAAMLILQEFFETM